MNKEEMIKLLRTKINSDEVKDKIININNLIVDIYQEGFNICYDIMEKLYQTQLTEANEKLEKIKEYILNEKSFVNTEERNKLLEDILEIIKGSDNKWSI